MFALIDIDEKGEERMIFFRAFRTIILVAPFLLTAGTAEGKIISGPYLQNVETDRITVMWETDRPGESRVEYRGADRTWEEAGSTADVTLHCVEITGLRADTPYRYRAVTGRDVSAEAIFRTAPPLGSSGFRFGVYGDSRSNEQIHAHVAGTMESFIDSTFVLNVGDIVPSSSSGKEYFREDFFQPLDGLARETPIFVARGNHEATNPHFETYLAHPCAASGSESYYSFDYGNLHVIVLDTTADFGKGSAQRTWLESDLEAASSEPLTDWIAAAFHHPPYSTGQHGPDARVRREICPLLEASGVNIVFTGHDHDYERIRQQNGVVYIVTGGGGAHLRDQKEKAPCSAVFLKLNNFVTVDVTRSALTVIARGVSNPGFADGEKIDSVVITKKPAWSPTALAGRDRQVDAGKRVVLDGSRSFDGDGNAFSFIWSQISGKPVTLTDADTAHPSFIPLETGRYVFQLICSDAEGLQSVPDTVIIRVMEQDRNS